MADHQPDLSRFYAPKGPVFLVKLCRTALFFNVGNLATESQRNIAQFCDQTMKFFYNHGVAVSGPDREAIGLPEDGGNTPSFEQALREVYRYAIPGDDNMVTLK